MPAAAVPQAPPAPSRPLLREAADMVRAVAGALLLAVILRTVFFQPFTIPSASMEPGLVTGDHILVSKFSYGWSRASLPFAPPIGEGRLLGRAPERGDVVVFRSPEDGRTAVIKRVIGLPGDRIQIQGGAVVVDDRPLDVRSLGVAVQQDPPGTQVLHQEERAPGGRVYRTYDRGPGREGDDTGVYRVPPGRYFVMGDNRDNSLDSRWPPGLGMGFVPAQDLMGEAKVVLFSWKAGASFSKPWTWFAFAPDRFLKPIR